MDNTAMIAAIVFGVALFNLGAYTRNKKKVYAITSAVGFAMGAALLAMLALASSR